MYKQTLRTLYFTFMQSNINYCLLNWGGAASIHLNRIRVSLNKAVRALCFKNGKQNANILYKELDLLPLDESYKLHLATFMWKLENNKLPESITSKYTNTTHTYNTRQSAHSTLQLPSVRLDHAKRFATYKGSQLCLYEVPLQFKTENKPKHFSKKYRKYLMETIAN